MKLRIMIAEDERLAREELIYLLSKEPDIALLPSAASGVEAVEMAQKHKPDAVFLDIEMPEMNGIQAAHLLHEMDPRPFIIFTTAYDQYALEAFQLEAVDYLLKPYDEERFRRTLDRVRARNAESGGNSGVHKQTEAPAAPAHKKNKLLVDDGDRMVVLEADLFLYAVKEEKVTHIHMADGRSYATKQTLQELEERLGAMFFRPHRSYLVNLDYIQEIEPWFNGAYNVILKDTNRTNVPVSRTAAKDLLRLLQG
ncbi:MULTISPECIES: LytTR family DNA-binding domain-containing protein [unclassified Paenibacillus]|uniref:LytR/AlgR family response regulator transcription factor n=1 Tax=unclassified Paenibacillus TaxID=185978 RepID=UPI001AE76FC6|nr:MULTISPECIES: LytTR family DNA-binding domain-containing protein [unclassified Paenibacillus]MBP1157618.1 two-component system response regulator LytT [Paenibacillus sp. PvP091]MBP1171645.1 two-component system response regulator LytT [Paenibacillus sp. PvR098]MBP2438026.1 two-component system response regulator LytT [Paenibacillus sp. PvP052]